MTASLRLVSFSIHRLPVFVLHVQFRTSVTLISSAKNDVGKRLNFRSRLAVAVRISPQVETFRFGSFPGRFKRLQSGLERKQMLDNQQTDHFIQLSASRNPVTYYQFARASIHSVTSRKRLHTWEVQRRYQARQFLDLPNLLIYLRIQNGESFGRCSASVLLLAGWQFSWHGHSAR